MPNEHALDRLFAIIAARKTADAGTSYTAKLLQGGIERCAKKFGEEAVEAAIAAVSGKKDATIAESADVLYHLLVLWAACGIEPEQVYAALAAREKRSGLEEKASRKTP
jgi:phosphoribosyl-ATP pyrophosphohydrolase